MDKMRKAFADWSQKRGVWPALTHEEIFFAGFEAAHTRAEAETVRRCVEAAKAAPMQWGDGEYGLLPIDGRHVAADAIRAAFPHVKD